MKFLVFADVHGNATALEAVLQKERDFDSVVFLGDAVSPGPQPNETIELLSALRGVFIQGNHERSMLHPESTANWPGGHKALMDWIYEVFHESGYELLKKFNSPGEYELDGRTFVLAHGDENKEVRHVLPDSPGQYFDAFKYGNNASDVLFGHSHVQFRRLIGNQEFMNPGSIGQNRCGHVLACYGLLVDGEFSHHHVAYDPTPWLDACDRIPTLHQFAEFRDWFKQQVLTGYSMGASEPWLSYSNKGYL